MLKVKVIAGGYLTEEQTIHCERLERLGASSLNLPLEFYITDQNHVLVLHYARRLDLQKSISAIDYFPEYTSQEIAKVSDIILEVLRKKPAFQKRAVKHRS